MSSNRYGISISSWEWAEGAGIRDRGVHGMVTVRVTAGSGDKSNVVVLESEGSGLFVAVDGVG